MAFVFAYLNSFGLAALIAVAFGMGLRVNLPGPVFRIGIGLLFGAAAALAMRNPIPVAEGVFVDPRNLFVGLSAAFLGPVGASAALAVGGASRISLGGVGVAAGLLSMTVAASAGLAWAHLMKDRVCTRPHCLLMLGGMISFALVGTLLLPYEARIALLTKAGPFMVGFNLVGALMFGALMERERLGAGRVRQLRVQATTDPLTGLLNRRGFDAKLEEMALNGKVSPTAIVLFDLDRFKAINDMHGHEVGDLVLAEVADILSRNVRKNDVVSRFGGEEFVILMPNTDLVEARRVGDRLRLAIHEVSLAALGGQRVSTSVGGYWCPTSFDHVEGLRKADRALYRAKASGRNRTEFYDSEAIAA